MSSISNGQFHIGKEDTFATPVTPTRSLDGIVSDTVAMREQEVIRPVGMRPGRLGQRVAVQTVELGAKGDIDLQSIGDSGFGLLLELLLGTPNASAPDSNGLVTYTYTLTDAVNLGQFFSLVVGRPDNSGDILPFLYSGGKLTGADFSQKAGKGELLVCKLSADYATETNDASMPSEAYPSPSTYFNWSQCSVLVNGDPVTHNVLSIDVSAKWDLDVDRRFLRGSTAKLEQIVKGDPKVDVKIETESQGTDWYVDFVNGTPVSLELVYQGASVGSGHSSLTISIPNLLFTGTTPVAEMTKVPTVSIPGEAQWDLEDTLLQVTYVTTDTSV